MEGLKTCGPYPGGFILTRAHFLNWEIQPEIRWLEGYSPHKSPFGVNSVV